MLPWGHAAVGYLLYSIIVRYRLGSGDRPAGGPVLALAIGTQFPDLVDKPLAWYLGVLPSGRSLAHSVFTAIVLLAILHWVAVQYERRDLNLAFVLGYLSHLLADVAYDLIRGEWEAVRILLWPIVSQTESETEYTIIEVLLQSSQSLYGIFEMLLFALATALWIGHRMPGLWLCLGPLRAVVPKR